MPSLILELSKYIFIVLMGIYMGLTFVALRKKDDDFRKAIYYFLEILTIIFFLLGMANLVLKYLEKDDYDMVRQLGILAAMEFALLLVLPLVMRIIYRDVNNLLLCQMEMLMAIGFIMLARLNYAHAKRQFYIIACSSVLFVIIPVLIKKLAFLKKLTWVYAGVGMAGLLTVLIAGNVINGSKLNFNVFGLIFQPSEMIKLVFAFFVAGLLYKSTKFKNILVSAAIAGVHVLILVASKDLGSALIYFIMYVAMVYVATGQQRYLLAGVLGGLAAAFLAFLVFSHVKL
ncbi:MAG: FtsW/RodA/SpoVE family cell cycle protein, partial [Lachnospiraceae bacterium]|nr:FtsW/RodA/SpoVE family cell cycle protein [Lachnospiraceae bacterium]